MSERDREDEALRERIAQLERRLEFYRDAYEQSPAMLVTVDAKTGEILRCNRTLAATVGRPRDELLGLPVMKLYHPSARSAARRAFEQFASTGAVKGARLALTRADGTAMPVLLDATAVRDGDGAVIQSRSTLRDITELVAAEQIPRASEEKFRNLVENISEVFYLLDLDGYPTYSSPAIQQLLGYTPEELRQWPIWRHLHSDDLEAAGSSFERTLKDGASAGEYRVRTKGGEYVWIRVSNKVRVKAGEPAGLQGTMIDITGRKAAEQALREHQEQLENLVRARTADLEATNRELEAFAYSISHDLRAPLRAVDGFCRIVLEDYGDGLDEVGRGHLGRARAGAQRMGRLIDELLSLARVSRVETEVQDVDLGALAAAAVSRMRALEPGREVTVEVAPDLQVRGDPTLLGAAMDNLMSNAWKFTAGRDDARVVVGRTGRGGEGSFFVRDNGAGFDMAHSDKLFEPFSRLHDACEFPGLGIGLASVKRAIERHGGSVWAEGKVDRGATFYFTLSTPGDSAGGDDHGAATRPAG